MKVLKSNEFWGRRSGSWIAEKPKGQNYPLGNVFKQLQWGHGANRNIKEADIKLVNVNKKWFKKNYKQKR